MSTVVTYKGNTLTTAASQTKVLKTAGKYMEDDLTIIDNSGTQAGHVYQDGDGYVVLDDDAGGRYDTYDATVTADSMLSGVIAYGTEGKVTGNIATKTSSNLTASGATVTVPAGYYAENATKTIASGSASTPATTVTANPSISVNSSTGLITATASATKSVTPTVSAGYVSSGTAGTITISGSNTSQLSTQAAKTVTPTESEQTAVAAGKYTTGIVKVGAISSTYVGSGITSRTSTDLSASDATVTVPAGYYANAATKSIAVGSVTAPSRIDGTEATVSTGTNTLTLYSLLSVTPKITSAGYISTGTAGYCSINLTASVNTKEWATITPTTTDQTIASGTYLTGSQVIKGDANLLPENILSGKTIFNVTGSVIPASTYTATISRTGTTTTGNPVIRLNGSGTSYNADGDTFTFIKGDYLDISVGTSDYYCSFYINDILVNSNTMSGLSFNYTLPECNIIIHLYRDSNSCIVRIYTPINTAVITGSGVDGSCYATLVSTGKKYFTKGDVIPYSSHNDKLYIRSGGSRGGGTIIVDGVTVANNGQNSVSYTLTPPDYGNLIINLDYGINSTVTVTTVTNLQDKTNINPSTSSQTVTSDSGYYGLNSVQINAMPSGTATAPASITGSSATISTGTNTLTLTKTISVTPNITTAGYISSGTAGNSSVSLTASVNMRSSSDLTASGATVTAPAGYYTSAATKTISAGSATAPASISGSVATVSTGTDTLTLTKTISVTPIVSAGYISSGTAGNSSVSLTANVSTRGATTITPSTTAQEIPANVYLTGKQTIAAMPSGTAGTPTATKGTVNNHSISVTPSVTNTTGYITGSTKTGTAVTVTAAELASGNKEITANGTDIDVVGYSTVSVNLGGMDEAELKKYIQRTTTFTDITWPSNLTSIGDYAFYGCRYFNPSSLPNGITIIGSNAFYNCRALSWTSLPNTVTTINSGAFTNCMELVLTSLPSGVTIIGSGAFNSCSKLALTSLPSGLTTIESNTFYSCSKLALTSLPSGIVTIGGNAFYNCYILALNALPNNVTTIGSGAFSNCYALTLTTLPNTITAINTGAFQYCENITSISCTGTITTLGGSAFLGSSAHPMKITSVNFPNMAISTLSATFGSSTAANACQLLEFVDLGNTNNIGSTAFTNCSALKTLVLRRTDAICSLTYSNAFNYTPFASDGTGGTVYVPSALISTYQTATNWKTLYNAGTITFTAIEGSAYDLS